MQCGVICYLYLLFFVHAFLYFDSLVLVSPALHIAETLQAILLEPLPKWVSKNQIVWGANYFGLPPTRGFFVWDKGEGFYNRDFAECEYAWTSFDRNAKVLNRDPLAKRDYHEGKIHPTQKPVALYEWILVNYAKPNDLILDTHLGSGPSRIACFKGGFNFVGFEIDAEYYEKQEKRFKNFSAQQRLF